MSTAIGQTLLNQIIDDLKLEGISGILQSALSFRFGEMHEAGAAFFGNNQLAAVLMANPGVKNALSGAGITNLLAEKVPSIPHSLPMWISIPAVSPLPIWSLSTQTAAHSNSWMTLLSRQMSG